MLDHARTMRREPTEPERKPWAALRAGQLYGLKCRRQAQLGPYIGDFYCPAAKLLIEIDGLTHIESATDIARTEQLETKGIAVFRFWNNQVMENLEGVLVTIADIARGRTPPPGLLPQGEGEQYSSPPPLEGGGRGEGSQRRITGKTQ